MRKIAILLFLIVLTASIAAQSIQIYTEDAPPLSFNGSDGKPAGLSVEIVQEIQRRLGNRDQITLVPWVRGLFYLNENANVFLFAMGRTAERNDRYQWIGPIYETAFAFYSLSGSKLQITSLDDAKKVPQIGVYRDDIRDEILTEAGFTNLVRVKDETTVARMLFAQRIDLMASSTSGIAGLLQSLEYKPDSVQLQYIFKRMQLYIGVSIKTNPTIVTTWNDTLDALKKDGTMLKLFQKYNVVENFPGVASTSF